MLDILVECWGLFTLFVYRILGIRIELHDEALTGALKYEVSLGELLGAFILFILVIFGILIMLGIYTPTYGKGDEE